jgi:hypothetical protein
VIIKLRGDVPASVAEREPVDCKKPAAEGVAVSFDLDRRTILALPLN